VLERYAGRLFNACMCREAYVWVTCNACNGMQVLRIRVVLSAYSLAGCRVLTGHRHHPYLPLLAPRTSTAISQKGFIDILTLVKSTPVCSSTKQGATPQHRVDRQPAWQFGPAWAQQVLHVPCLA
jgi:hypothetical protein